MFLFFILYIMENILLSKSEKTITDCKSFNSKDWTGVKFSIDYVVNKKTDDTYTNEKWETKNKWIKEVQFKIFDRSSLPQSFDKKSDSEICQELKWKSLITEVKIWW
jgi:hypothetical protein